MTLPTPFGIPSFDTLLEYVSKPRRTMVFFDLDNTLFDHDKSLHYAMALVRTRFLVLREIPVDVLVEKYNKALNIAYDKYLRKEIAYEEQDAERVNLFFRLLGLPELDNNGVAHFRSVYKEGYRINRDAMPGSIETLESLRHKGYRTAIITNGPTKSQIAKAEYIDFLDLVERVITSEEAGYHKPDVRIFHHAMQELGIDTKNVYMVGDSVEADVKGALDAKITPILYSPSSNSSSKVLFEREISVIRQFDQLPMLLEPPLDYSLD